MNNFKNRLIWTKLVSLFSIFEIPKIPRYSKIEKQLAKGNVYLQMGYYETKEDILEQKKQLFSNL